MLYVSQLEQIIALLLMAFLAGDVIVKLDIVVTSLKTEEPVQNYFKGWMSETVFKEWYMFIGWDRVVAAFIVSLLLTFAGYELVMLVFCIKLGVDLLYHLFLRYYVDRLF